MPGSAIFGHIEESPEAPGNSEVDVDGAVAQPARRRELEEGIEAVQRRERIVAVAPAERCSGSSSASGRV